MNKILNNNTLLSQKEIDTLILFLTQHNNKVQDNAVLSQDSIDKLVSLLQNKGSLNSNLFELADHRELLNSVAPSLAGYSLHFSIDEATQYIVINAKNNEGATVKITPAGLSDGQALADSSEWGYCIEPAVFDKIATVFDLKYSKAEYDKVCKSFALKRYGNEDAVIPALYMPTEKSLAENMTE